MFIVSESDNSVAAKVRAILAAKSDNAPPLLSMISDVMRIPWDGKRVTTIIRVSTRKQARLGFSLEAQEKEILKYCKDKGLDNSIFKIVKSGFSLGHTREALDHAERNKNAIVVPGLDRFSRHDVTKIFEDCGKRRIRLIGLDNGREGWSEEIASGAHSKSERSRNTKRGIGAKRDHTKKWGRSSLADDARKWRIRVRILELDQQGVSAGAIEKQLRREGAKNPPTRTTIKKFLNEVHKREKRYPR